MREGSTVAEEILYKKYSYYISKKICEFHLYFEYEDIFQESLIVLYKSLDNYIDSSGGFFPFFNKNLQNKLISIKRHLKYVSNEFPNDEIIEFRDSAISFPLELPDEEAFKNLTKKEKSIIKLKYIKHLTTKEIAEEFGLKVMQVYYLLSKIKKKIKKNLE